MLNLPIEFMLLPALMLWVMETGAMKMNLILMPTPCCITKDKEKKPKLQKLIPQPKVQKVVTYLFLLP
jgi:hypothetical protein